MNPMDDYQKTIKKQYITIPLLFLLCSLAAVGLNSIALEMVKDQSSPYEMVFFLARGVFITITVVALAVVLVALPVGYVRLKRLPKLSNVNDEQKDISGQSKVTWGLLIGFIIVALILAFKILLKNL